MKKRTIAVWFGGKSGEHEVSIMSALSVLRNLSPTKFTIIPIGITKTGMLMNSAELSKILTDLQKDIPLVFPETDQPTQLIDFQKRYPSYSIDIVFPVLHGPNGEDGTVQGFLELLNIPYVGAGVAASAVGMDKDLMKQILKAHSLPIFDWITIFHHQYKKNPSYYEQLVHTHIGYPCFIKPCNMGSSVGVYKCKSEKELAGNIQFALQYDRKLIIEKTKPIRELEISVLGNDIHKVSVPGEVVPCNEFYDYDAKYVDEDSKLLIPAPIDEDLTKKIQDLALKTYQALDLNGMARVDIFLSKTGDELFINEVNTLPGFTKISMYPKLWEASGLAYPDLINELVELGFERHAMRQDYLVWM